MKLKLSFAEFTILFQLLEPVIDLKPVGIDRHLLHGVLVKLYLKFHRKSAGAESKYSIKMEKEEACAFYMYTQSLQAGLNIFTTNLLLQINNQIHKTYGV